MSASNINQHPLFTGFGIQSRRILTQLRRVPASLWRALYLLIIVLWMVHSLADGFWVLVPEPTLEAPSLAAPVQTSQAPSAATSVDLAALQEVNLFGESSGEPVAEAPPEPTLAPGVEQAAVDTSLSLRLQGVMASSNPEQAWAIIANGNNQALYGVGDTLPQGNNVKLVKVMDQRVILDNNGRYESLWLYSKEDAQQRVSAAPYEAPVYEEPEPEAYDEDPAATSDYSTVDAPDAGDGMSSEPEPEVRELTVSAQNVTSISEVVRFTAARGEDGMMGYRVQPGRNRELFEQAGLQPGDVVTAVNGIELDDPRQIRAVYQVLQSASQAELSISRNGEPVQVHITLDSTR